MQEKFYDENGKNCNVIKTKVTFATVYSYFNLLSRKVAEIILVFMMFLINQSYRLSV